MLKFLFHNVLIFSLGLCFSGNLYSSGYLAEVPDRLVDLRLIFEGVVPEKGLYLKKIGHPSIRVSSLCKPCGRGKLIALVPAPLPVDEDIEAYREPEPAPSQPLEVSAGADPDSVDLIIGGKRLGKRQLRKALLDPDEFLSVFEKDISKSGGPQEKVHIPFSMPYDGASYDDSSKVPSKAVYRRD